MSALGQKQTFAMQQGMSALPPIAAVHALADVRFVQKADIAALIGCDEYPWPPSRTLNETALSKNN